MNYNFYDIIALVASSLSLLSCGIFIFINKSGSIPRIFLTLAIGGVGYGLFITTLLNSRLIEEMPFLYRTAMPIAFIIGPSCYYYITTSLIQPLVFPKKFFLHLIPFMLAFIVNIPFLIKTNQEKIDILQRRYTGDINLLSGPDGWITGSQMATILGIFSILYLFQSFRILLKNKNEIRRSDPASFWWYLYLLIALSFIFLSLIYSAAHPDMSAYNSFTIIFSFLMISLLIYLFTRPDILYGTLVEKIEEGNVKSFGFKQDNPLSESDQNAVDPALIPVYKKKIEECIDKDKPYLRRDLRITDLSKQLDIPRHHLSWVVNNIYNLNFNDFINKNRLSYIESNFSNDEFKRMTLEGIAYDAGFNSRTTFTHAVKKFYNCTPSEHFKKNLN
ncbi:helix-turn-helix domain-containing protein [Fulvivirga sedimenti]|uniref:AraC family transcriptional regulator n=1 Tax=Fulvivirga sedimenti TaxID=2879465 RepID=A0A9X1HPL8_9BACT|nr:AraC family transcriptional regulator [Fulvivirga sedimenti]MCA6074457.1 AraC family transcriptional regulator [Fulvivirga sedimenti]